VYQLTPRGRELEDVLRALIRWGLSSMPAGRRTRTPYSHSGAPCSRRSPSRRPARRDRDHVGIDTDEAPGEAVQAVLRHDGFEIHRGAAADSDVTLSGPAQLVGGVLSGLLTPTRASRHGLTIRGNRSALAGLLSTTRTRARSHDMTYTETDLVPSIERLAGVELAALTQQERDGIDQFTAAAPRPSTDSCPAWT